MTDGGETARHAKPAARRRRLGRRVVAVAAGLAGLLVTGQAFALIGGTPADETYPFLAAMIRPETGKTPCGGSVIRADWVVTAEHCIAERSPETIQFRIGSLDRTEGGDLRTVDRIATRPGSDIALMHLSAPVPVAPVPVARVSPGPGEITRLLGWGAVRADDTSERPVLARQLDVRVRPDGDCADAPTPIDAPTELCTDNPDGAGPCHADSGGPALARVGEGWELAGVTSRSGTSAKGCAAGPGISVDVTSFADWIDAETGTSR